MPRITAIVVTRFKTIGIALLMAIAGSSFLAGSAEAQAPLTGRVDRSFGRGGRAFSDLPQAFGRSQFLGVAPLPEGRSAVSFSTEPPAYPAGPTARAIEVREADGTLDPAFGRGGRVATGQVGAISADASGRILYAEGGTLRRLMPDGTPDPGFDGDGTAATVPFSISKVAIAPDGDILLAGERSVRRGRGIPPISGTYAARMMPDGSLDQSFGEGGVATVIAPDDLGHATEVDGLAVLADGSVLILIRQEVTRLGRGGRPDPSFGGEGTAAVGGVGESLVAFPDGGYAVALEPFHEHSGAAPLEVRRFDAEGARVEGFRAVAPRLFGPGAQLLATADGGFLLGGVASSHTNPGPFAETRLLLYRFDFAGTLVTSFGEGGVADATGPDEPQLLPNDARLGGLAQTASGNLLIAGSDGSATLAARTATGHRLPGFGPSDGTVVETARARGTTAATGIAVGAGRRVLVPIVTTAAAVGVVPGLLPLTASGAPASVPSAVGYLRTPTSQRVRAAAGSLFALRRSGGGFSVLRFDERGRLDRRYAEGGEFPVPRAFIPVDFVVAPGGTVTLFGVEKGRDGMAALRLTRHGRVDRRFGRAGVALVPFDNGRATPEAAVTMPGGGIVLMGRHGRVPVLVGLDDRGEPEPSFGHDGRVIGPVRKVGPQMKLLRAGGSLIAQVRVSPAPDRRESVIFRISHDGVIDRSFGRSGSIEVARTRPVALIYDRGDTVIVSATPGDHRGASVSAYLPDGSPDPVFGRGGSITVGRHRKAPFHPVAAVVQPGGPLLIAGTAGSFEHSRSRAEVLALR